MNLIFDICPTKENIIRIWDKTIDNEQYIPEDLPENSYNLDRYYNFKYSETCTINIIDYISTKEEVQEEVLFTEHTSFLDEVYFEVIKDGYYKITHIILPTIKWLERQKQNKYFDLSFYNAIYVTDGNNIYKYLNNALKKCNVEEVKMVNSTGTTISRCTKPFFSTYNLYKCYINYCKQLFEQISSKCIEDSKNDTFIRDFIWMTVNVINYYIEQEQYIEAQRLLEEINGCNGFCREYYPKLTINNCGCHA